MVVAKCLIVDDSETLRQQLEKVLTKAGHQVIWAENGHSGLVAIAGNLDIDIIFCDFNMPGMDGLTMCGKAKDVPGWRNIPIFMLTTESNAGLKEQGKLSGVRAWIMKPFDEVKLLAAMGKVLNPVVRT